jgi:hypothetical protein
MNIKTSIGNNRPAGTVYTNFWIKLRERERTTNNFFLSTCPLISHISICNFSTTHGVLPSFSQCTMVFYRAFHNAPRYLRREPPRRERVSQGCSTTTAPSDITSDIIEAPPDKLSTRLILLTSQKLSIAFVTDF